MSLSKSNGREDDQQMNNGSKRSSTIPLLSNRYPSMDDTIKRTISVVEPERHVCSVVKSKSHFALAPFLILLVLVDTFRMEILNTKGKYITPPLRGYDPWLRS
jgi:hypothetical protein